MNVLNSDRIDFYRDPNVRARIREFIGSGCNGEASSEFLSATDADSAPPFKSYSPFALNWLFSRGCEICRSLWDHNGLIADFDIEYVNFDDGAEAFVNQERIFSLQEPVERAIKQLLEKYRISCLHMLSGRGHHFVWRIKKDSIEFKQLAELGRAGSSLWNMAGQLHGRARKPMNPALGHAFVGLGLIMEFLACEVKQIAAPTTEIPVEPTAVEVGPSERDRELISLDISEYGDPLYARTVRVPFSVYRKPWQQRWAVPLHILEYLEPFFVIPLDGANWRDRIGISRNAELTQKLARQSSGEIPDGTRGTGRLLGDYERSKLAKFHQFFYSHEQHPSEVWPETYDRTPIEILPMCARLALEHPNDLLLRPAWIRRVVRVMLALGWHPRHIAGLITSKYQRDFGWTQFTDVDPATRADFYTRVFAGLFAAGIDDLVDLNCVSAQEQKTCTGSNCGFNLTDFRTSALERRAHGKLAHRPFNRLFLSSKHS